MERFRTWYASLSRPTQNVLLGVGGVVVILALLSLAQCARAVEPGWYAPGDGSGQGILVRCGTGGCAAAWLTYADNEQIWLTTVENCERGKVCEAEFARTAGDWFGTSVEILEPEVTATLEPTPDSLLVDFEAIGLFPHRCDTGTGGLIFRNCVGAVEFFLLAR